MNASSPTSTSGGVPPEDRDEKPDTQGYSKDSRLTIWVTWSDGDTCALPDEQGRTVIIETAVKNHRHGLGPEDIRFIVESTSHFSGADMHCLCKEAAMGPIRDVHLCENMNESDLPPITRPHFEAALRAVKASVSEKDLEQYRLWDEEFGST